MIAATPLPGQIDLDRASEAWQQQLAQAVTDPLELCELLQLDRASVLPIVERASDFALRVPRSFVAKMRSGDPNDPLLLQVLPLIKESAQVDGFSVDPVGDMHARAGAGVLHKYHGRALLVATGACAIHCRYCFRRHFPYAEESALHAGWRSALETLRADPSISEVILSGGDPWSLSTRRLQLFTDGLASIAHVRRLRIHTRYPLVLPDRINAGLLNWLAKLPLKTVVVIHANHPREIDNATRSACESLRAVGVTLLNQSVLLSGVNDDEATLTQLSEALFDAGVLPYYLHLLDKVHGAAHFEVDTARALQLHAALVAQLPGYLVPRLVREVAGGVAKESVRP